MTRLKQEIEDRNEALLTSHRFRRNSPSTSTESGFSVESFSIVSLLGFERFFKSQSFLNGEHNFANVAFISAILGIMIGVGLAGILFLEQNSYSISALFVFVLGLGLFHILEYLLAAIVHPEGLKISSFLFSNNGYKEVIGSAFAEFAIEYYYDFFQTNGILFKIGLSMVIVGQIVRILAIITAGKSFTHEIATEKSTEQILVTRGIYSIMRHPSYFGFFLWSVGSQIMLCNPAIFAVSLFTCYLFFRDRIEYEELLLVSFYQQEYREYQDKVWSGIPFVK